MDSLIAIAVCLICLVHESEPTSQNILLINDSSAVQHTPPYDVINFSRREKRDQASWFYPEVDRNHISCEPNIYEKLHTCSLLAECKSDVALIESMSHVHALFLFLQGVVRLSRVVALSTECQILRQSDSQSRSSTRHEQLQRDRTTAILLAR